MTTPDADTGLQAALYEFLVRYLEDREQGSVRPVADYQTLFPRWKQEIAARFEELETGQGEATFGEDVAAAWASLPAKLGRFRIVRELGRGGQAVVYLADDPTLHRSVAVKVLTGASALDGDRLARFKREAEVAARLEHPAICEVFDAGVEGGVPYIVMRYVPGKTLAHRLARAREAGDEPPIADRIPEWLRMFETAAAALHAAHEAGVIHRDVKPANIMLGDDDEPVLLDFGLARDEESELSMTRSGDFLGTPGFMSPEQVAGQPRPLDRRADVYSLGAALYECLTLRPPFEAPTREALYHAILTREAPDARSANPAVSRDLAVVLQTALAKERDRRYETARDMADELAAVREGRPIRARPLPAYARLARWARRKPAVATLVAVVALGLPAVTGLAGYLLSKREAVALGEERQRLDRAENLVDQGYFKLLERDRSGATEDFDAALALVPSDPFALCGLALTHLVLYGDDEEDPRAALAVLDEHARHFAGDPEFSAMQAWLLRRAGRAVEAQALEAEFEGPGAMRLFMEGLRHLPAAKQGDLDAGDLAFAALLRALMLSRPPRLLTYSACVSAAGRSRTDEATLATLVEAMVNRWPDSPQAWRYVGDAYWDRDSEQAVRAYEQVVALTRDNHEAHAWLGYHLNRVGRRDAALASLERALDLEPDFALAHEYWGIAHLSRGNLEQAMRGLGRAIELNPRRPFTRAYLAEALRRRGELDLAIEAAQHAVQLSENCMWGHYQLARALRDRGRYDEAVAPLEKVFAVSGDYPVMKKRLHELGGLHLVRGEPRAALAELHRVLERTPRSGAAWSKIGQAHLALGEHDRAIDAHRKAVAFRRESGQWHFYGRLARALHAADRTAEARRELELLTRKHPAETGAWLQRAWFLVDPGMPPEQWRPREALDAAETAARMQEGPHQLRALGVALFRAGAHERARATLQDHIARLDSQQENGPEHFRLLATAHAFLAMTRHELGETQPALASLHQARESLGRVANPDYGDPAVREAEAVIERSGHRKSR